MAKQYINKAEGTDPIVKARNITVAAPYDVRSVVSTYNDLFDKNTYAFSELYVGMLVITYDTQDVYVLSQLPGSRDNATAWAEHIKWKKINISEINPEDNLDYYQDKLGARVVESVSELTDPNFDSPYAGMFAVVIDTNSDDSEDENGLYVLKNLPNTTVTNWYRVLGSSGSGTVISGLDVADVITFDGSTPNAGTGFSISKDGEYVEEDYTDTLLEAGKYYTSNGINSYAVNGGNKLEGVDYITLTNGGSSYIKLYSNQNSDWIELYIVDNSLGFTATDVAWVDAQGTEHTMDSNTLSLPKGTLVSFTVDVQLRGMTETRDDDPTTYTFGTNPGSDYEDVDIYTPNVLPTVYAYSEGTSVRVLTEADKTELINRISENTFEFNVENHILRLVH